MLCIPRVARHKNQTTVIGLDHMLEARRGDADTFYGGQHRDGGRDDRVAVKEGGGKHPSADHQQGASRCASAVRARTPPSPSLSYLSTIHTCLTETIRSTAQSRAESVANTFSGDTAMACGPEKASLNAWLLCGGRCRQKD
jgi:hypothetical protein